MARGLRGISRSRLAFFGWVRTGFRSYVPVLERCAAVLLSHDRDPRIRARHEARGANALGANSLCTEGIRNLTRTVIISKSSSYMRIMKRFALWLVLIVPVPASGQWSLLHTFHTND